eukprot:2055117-Amphidinium_carterae.1
MDFQQKQNPEPAPTSAPCRIGLGICSENFWHYARSLKNSATKFGRQFGMIFGSVSGLVQIRL